MTRLVESTHKGFLLQIMGDQVRQQGDGSWETPAAEEVIQAAGMQSVDMYIGRLQATVAQWVDLQLLLEVCTWEIGYEGGIQEETAMAETREDIRGAKDHARRGILVGNTKVSGLGQVRGIPGIKVWAADKHWEPGDVKVEK